ncbi:competence protein CoiA family protein [Streptomyces mirabilis]|uniref:competence protein CoiA family protein n=1 Tax=Streptomyces mirabilis TaxID=68239 RepID=UPI00224F3DC7|nr:competence protein CoiA family protein [Streptomyces mirabilis]MCX4428940.1 competence protein CoiA family protein [Streptomyces mirabilis]
MPFTALHPDLGRLDATLPNLGGGLDWSQVHKVRPRIPLACPECAWSLHPKVSRYGVRFFCHDPGRPPSCELSNESWEHHMLKLEMATAIRAAGWYATLEVPAEDGSWRADVMASSVDGTHRMAWEAQLSPITLDDIAARTDRYLDEGIRVCWVSPHEQTPQWISTVPAVRVRTPEEREQLWIVDDGLAGFDLPAGRWVFREAPLSQFVRWALHGQLVPALSLPRYRRAYRVVDGKQRRFRRSQWWTSLQSVGDQEKHEVMRQRQEAANAEREARQKEREEEAERRRRAVEEQERVRRAEESRVHWEKVRRQWAEEDARLAQEQAEREEIQRQALETARAWWGRLSPQQRTELFTAVAEYAWRESNLRVEIPEKPTTPSEYAYGVPVYALGKQRPLYGVVRPCPSLVASSPHVARLHAFARSSQEARELAAVMPEGRVTDLDLPEHEQLTMY